MLQSNPTSIYAEVPSLEMKLILVLLSLGLAIAIVLPTTPALAQEDPYLQCADIKKSKARLKCYDDILSAQHPEVVQKIEKATKTQQRADFALTSVPEENRDVEKLKYVDVVIVKYYQDRYKKWRLVTEDGQVWKQVDSLNINMRGETIKGRFKRGLAGSYFFSLAGNKYGIKVQRIR